MKLRAEEKVLYFGNRKVNFYNINEVKISSHSFWLRIIGYSRLIIKIYLNDTPHTLNLIVNNNQAEEFSVDLIRKIQKQLFEMLSSNIEKLNIDVQKIDCFFKNNFYIRRSSLDNFKNHFNKKQLNSTCSNISLFLQHPLLKNEDKTPQNLKEQLSKLNDFHSEVPRRWITHNDDFIKNQKIEYKYFFDNVEEEKLTEEQVDASLVFDDANITVAAAGSGKTSVMVAKAGFAISSGYAKPSEI
jgi:DNA helicase-4